MSNEYMKRAMFLDMPRIIRKDTTLITEMVAKYRGLEAHARGAGLEDAADALANVPRPLAEARELLEQSLAVAQVPPELPDMMGTAEGEGDAYEQERPVAAVHDVVPRQARGGRAQLLSQVLVDSGFARSSVLAKRMIRGGAIKVDGQLVQVPTAMLEPGAHHLEVQGVDRAIEV